MEGTLNMSTPAYQRFDNDDDPPLFSTAPLPPTFEPPSISQHAPIVTTIDMVDRQMYAGRMMPTEPPPSDYMILSVLTCLFCSWPTGCCAIFASCETKNRIMNGDVEGARRSSRTALLLNILTIVIGIGLIIFLSLYAIYRFEWSGDQKY
ncbi:trafficking regulator of GLUT4 1-like isoform X3 [Argopecten irradians]|uniref:trafficking regulator of GLUT4 1-like isoform X3 n=1 Tax=Argopecten irradians TaxID=31199 RepID=UPI00371EA275